MTNDTNSINSIQEEKGMADYLKVETRIVASPKISRLAKRLEVDYRTMVGTLVIMWGNCKSNNEDGNVTTWTPDDFVFHSQWTGDPKDFFKALKEERFLDKREDMLLMHDWLDYAGDHLKGKYKQRRVDLLKQIWAMHGRVYPRDAAGDPMPDEPVQPEQPDTPEKAEEAKLMEGVRTEWNHFAGLHGLSLVSKVTDRRRRGIKARLRDTTFSLTELFRMIEEQPFLFGGNDRGWKVDFDWVFLHTDNFLKIMEGKYKNAKPSAQRAADSSSGRANGTHHETGGGVKTGPRKYAGLSH